MTRTNNSNADADQNSLGRRSFLRGATALGVGLTALPSLASNASAASKRFNYQMMEGTKYETTVYVYESGRSGPTTLVIGGQHGDEKSGYYAADKIAQWSVDCGKLVVIPRSNVIAIADGERHVNGVDLNRQYPPLSGDCTHRLARGIWGTVERHDPDWVFDLHSSRGIYKSGDGGVGQAMFPTWTSPSRSCGEKTVTALNDAYNITGTLSYQMGNTLDADSPKLMHRVAGMLDRPGYIMETTEKVDLSAQVKWHLFAVEHVMNQYGQRRGLPPTSNVEFDAGTITLDDYWQTYSLTNRYSHPTVIAPSLSYVGDDPAHVRVNGLAAQSFEARVEEWAYLNDLHYEEQAGYLVLNSDSHTSDDGKQIEVGRRHVNHEWERITFDSQFASTPVVLATVQSTAGSDPVITRIQNVTRSSFEVRVQEEDAEHDGEYHYDELVGWTAFEPGRGLMGGSDYETDTVPVDHNWKHIEFSRSYENPVFLAGVMSYEGWNTVTVRYKNLTSTGVDVFLQEDQSADTEMSHDSDETVGYFVVEG